MAKIYYSKELIQEAVDHSKSIAGVCRYIGLQPVGGNYKTIHRKIQLYQIDISHFTGQRWNKGEHYTNNVAQFSLTKILQENVNYRSDTLKQRLYAENYKEKKCECCGLDDPDIVYELHHINGNHYDNRLENLQILCPNCHSKTSNFRNRGNKNIEPLSLTSQRESKKTCICLNCGKSFQSDRYDRVRKFCSVDCYREYISTIGGNLHQNSEKEVFISKEELQELCEMCTSITEISEKLGKDRTSVRNYMKKYNLYNSFKQKH